MSDPPPPPQPLPPPPDAVVRSHRRPPAQAAPVTNGMAISSLITGLIGVVLFWMIVPSIVLGILAVVFGAVAKGRANRGAPNGTMAVVGLVLGVVALVAAIVMIVLVLGVGSTTEVRIDDGSVEVSALALGS